MIYLLQEKEMICVRDLHIALGLPQSTVSRHLSRLHAAHLVSNHREANQVFYSIAPELDPPARLALANLARLLSGDPQCQKDAASRPKRKTPRLPRSRS